MKKLLIALVVVLALTLALTGAVYAHVPPVTGPGGQDGCITDSHDPADVAGSAPDNDCGTGTAGGPPPIPGP